MYGVKKIRYQTNTSIYVVIYVKVVGVRWSGEPKKCSLDVFFGTSCIFNAKTVSKVCKVRVVYIMNHGMYLSWSFDFLHREELL